MQGNARNLIDPDGASFRRQGAHSDADLDHPRRAGSSTSPSPGLASTSSTTCTRAPGHLRRSRKSPGTHWATRLRRCPTGPESPPLLVPVAPSGQSAPPQMVPPTQGTRAPIAGSVCASYHRPGR